VKGIVAYVATTSSQVRGQGAIHFLSSNVVLCLAFPIFSQKLPTDSSTEAK